MQLAFNREKQLGSGCRKLKNLVAPFWVAENTIDRIKCRRLKC